MGEGFYVEGLSIIEKRSGRSDSKVVNAMKGYACALLGAGEASPKGPTPIEPDEVTKAVRKRAKCWLYGFDDNCAEDPIGQYESLINGRARSLTIPTYPRGLARILGGRVFVAVRIDEEGKVIQAKTVCGVLEPDLVEPSLNAARESRFTPTLLAGKPVQVNGAIVYNFVPVR
jgi:outer membrane biosynthesis protein TonB